MCVHVCMQVCMYVKVCMPVQKQRPERPSGILSHHCLSIPLSPFLNMRLLSPLGWKLASPSNSPFPTPTLGVGVTDIFRAAWLVT